MKYLFLVPALALTAACDATMTTGAGTGMPADAAVAYDAAVASVGCTLRSEKDYLPVELQTGLTREQVLQITSARLARKQAVKLPDGTVQLTTGACKA